MKCEYDLAGVPGADVCPECGTANRASFERRERFVRWNSPRDTILFCLFVLNLAFAVGAMPKYALLSLLLLAVILVCDSATVPECSFGLVRIVKTLAIAGGMAMLLLCWAVLIW